MSILIFSRQSVYPGRSTDVRNYSPANGNYIFFLFVPAFIINVANVIHLQSKSISEAVMALN